MTKPDIHATPAGNPIRSAALRTIIPVGLTLVLFILSVFLLFIPSIEKQMMAQKREMIRNLTDTCWSLLNLYHERVTKGELSLEDAQARIIDRVRGMRYGPQGKDYFWINDMSPRLLMHPHRPDLEGKDLSDYTDPRGKSFLLESVKKVRQSGDGYVEYVWQWKDDPDRTVQKISYVKGFKPWGWIIGTGIYVEDVRADMASIIRKTIMISSCILAVAVGLSLFIIWQTLKIEKGRQDSEKEFLKSKNMFRTLGEDAPFGISILDSDRRFEYLNPKFTEILGYTREDLPDKKTWFEKAYPEKSYREKAMDAWRRDLGENARPGEVKPRVFTVRCKDGRDKIVHFRAVALEEGRELTTYEDITEQAEMERALKENERKYIDLYEKSRKAEELYRSLLNSSADAIVIYDIEGRAQYVSPAFTRIFGWTGQEVEGKRIPFLPESEKEETMAIIYELVEHGTPCHGFETKRFTKDGKLLDVSISASRYDDHERNPAGMLVIIRDISERKALESQFYEAQKMESIGTLAGGVAHDFNNLLMAIQGNVSLLLMDKDPGHPDQDRLHNIQEHIQRGAHLTRQLLGFARGGKYEIRPTDLNEITRTSAELFARMKKEIRVHSEYQEGVWLTEADQGQIEQVLMNLYVNAGHAMPDGGDLTIATRNLMLLEDQAKAYSLRPGKYVRISVSDTGVGMDEDTLKKIFDPFFTTREVGRGTGLGLASAYGIIRNHGGSIRVRSAKGKGAAFDIYLPALDKQHETRDAEPDASPEIAPGGETVLLVDDEEGVMEVGEEILRRLGYTVLVAASGKEALEQCRKNRGAIDLVILDMIMPGMAGMEAYDRIREENPDLLVLLSSGYSIDGQASEILKRGCNGFIQKPFTMAALSQKIREVLACAQSD